MNFRKFSQYAFYAFVFLLPFQTVLLLREPMIGGAKWQYGTIGVYFTDILLAAVICFFFIATQLWRKIEDLRFLIYESENTLSWISILKSKIVYHKSTIALALLILWTGLSILWAPDHVLAGYFFVKLLLGAGVFFVARSLGDREVRMVVRILIAAAVIQSLLGIWQFVTQSTFASTLLGVSHYEVWQAGTSVLKNESGRWLRAYGSFPHPNMLGGFLGAALVLLIADFRFHPPVGRTGIADCSVIARSLRRGNPEEYIRMENTGLPRARGLTLAMTKIAERWHHASFIFYHSSLVLILLGLILTFSRTAWLGAAMGIAFFLSFAWCSSQGRSLISRTVLDSILVLVVATVLFVGVFHEVVFPRFDGGTIDREGSIEDRVQSLRDAEPLIAAHPFLGVGAGNFTAAVMKGEEMGVRGEKGAQEITGKMGEGEEKGKMGAKGEMGERGRPVWTIQPAHNVFVLVLTELGVVGLLLFVGFLFSIVMRGMKIYDLRLTIDDKKSQSSLLQSEIFNRKSAILLVLLPSLFLDHWLWSSHLGIMFFFLLAGICARCTKA